jgi:uncharacterized ubiquitin-like protein YukD
MNESEINEYFPLGDDLLNINSTPLNDTLYWYIDRTPDFSNFVNYDIDYTINNFTILSIKRKISIIKENIEISDEEQNCCICMETREKLDICSLNCNHKFCAICIKNCIKTQIIYKCSLCVQPVETIKVQKFELINLNELD